MAVGVTFNTQNTLPFPTVDQRFPTFRFIATGTIVGDATGGRVDIRMELGLTRPGILSGLIYGIRHFFGKADTTGAGAVLAEALSWRLAEKQTEVDAIIIPLVTVDNGANGASAALNTDVLLGRQSGPAVSAAVQFQWENNLNLTVYQCYVEGFIWRPAAALEGGPLFPGEFPTP